MTLLSLLALLLALPLVGPARAEDPPAGGAENAAPAFTLKDPDGKEHTLAQYAGKWVVLEWTNHGCPFVVAHYAAPHKNMQRLQQKFADKDVVWLSICSSAPGKQGFFTPEEWKAKIAELGLEATVLLDPEGTVGHAYDAKTTPEIRIIDPKGAIVYAGAIDDQGGKAPRQIDVVGATNYLERFLDAALAGTEITVEARTKPYGCTVKYATP
jgi:peroxiredoxin